jgi:hypothetical protein
MTNCVHKNFQFGEAPFTFVGVWSAPSRSLLEQNPSAYNLQMQAKPKFCHFGCDHCGTAIEHHYILRDANGDRYCVGSSCIAKVNDVLNLSDAEAAERKRQRQLRRARAEAKREQERITREAKLQARLTAERERNGGLTDAEVAQQRAEQERHQQRIINEEKFGYFIRGLSEAYGNFATDVANGLRDGRLPSGRGVTIMLEIIAKGAGRRGSKAYESAYAEAEAKWEEVA